MMDAMDAPIIRLALSPSRAAPPLYSPAAGKNLKAPRSGTVPGWGLSYGEAKPEAGLDCGAGKARFGFA